MNKIQELAAKRMEDVLAKWRTDTGDAELVEAYLQLGRKLGGGYTDDSAGKLARIFDLNGRLTSAQVANVRNAMVKMAQEPALEEKPKRKYTRRLAS
jgi:hypothetical protein